MNDDDGTDLGNRPTPPGSRSPSETAETGTSMRARAWIIAYLYHVPDDYGVPTLPDWCVVEDERPGIAFAETEDDVPFIRAERPVRVRR